MRHLLKKFFKLKYIQYPLMVYITYYATFKAKDSYEIGLHTDNIFGQLAFAISIIVLVMYIIGKLLYTKKFQYAESLLSFVCILLLGIGSGINYFDLNSLNQFGSSLLIYVLFFLAFSLFFIVIKSFRKKNAHYDDFKKLLQDTNENFEGKFVLARGFNGKDYVYYIITFKNPDDKVNLYLYNSYIVRRKVYTLEDLQSVLKKSLSGIYLNDIMFKNILILNDYDYDEFIEYLRKNSFQI